MYVHIFGTWTYVRVLGDVADFCPICREVRRWRVRERRVVHWVLLIPYKQKTVDRSRTCEACAVSLEAVQGAYASYLPTRLRDAAALIQETNPGLLDRIADRLELENRVRRGRITEEERWRLLAEPFTALERTARTVPVGPLGISGALLLFFAGTFAVAGVGFIGPGGAWPAGAGVSAAGLAGLAAGVWMIRTDQRRWKARRIVRPLATALAPLEPTPEELARVFAAAAKARMRIVRRLNADDLGSALAERMERVAGSG